RGPSAERCVAPACGRRWLSSLLSAVRIRARNGACLKESWVRLSSSPVRLAVSAGCSALPLTPGRGPSVTVIDCDGVAPAAGGRVTVLYITREGPKARASGGVYLRGQEGRS